MAKRTNDLNSSDPLSRPIGYETDDTTDTTETLSDMTPEDTGLVEGYAPASGYDSGSVESELDTDDELETTRIEIEQTRVEIAGTVDAIKDKLDPQHLKEHAKEAIHEATIGRAQETAHHLMDQTREAVSHAGDTARDTGHTLVESVKGNPWPAVLIGAGLGWLFINTRNQAQHHEYQTPASRYREGHTPYAGTGVRYTEGSYSPTDLPYPPAGTHSPSYETPHESPIDRTRQQVGETMGQAQERVGEIADHARDMTHQARERVAEAASGAKERVGEATHHAKERVGEVTHHAKERVGEIAETTKNRVGEMAGTAREKVGHVTEQVHQTATHLTDQTRQQARVATEKTQDLWEENPLVMGAAAAVLGAVMAYTLPETEKERSVVAEPGGRIFERVQETAQEVRGRVQAVAQEVTQKVQSAAQEALEQAKPAFQEAVQAAKPVAQGVMDTAREGIQDAVDTAKTGAQEVMGTAKEGAQDVADTAKAGVQDVKKEASNALPSGTGETTGVADFGSTASTWDDRHESISDVSTSGDVSATGHAWDENASASETPSAWESDTGTLDDADIVTDTTDADLADTTALNDEEDDISSIGSTPANKGNQDLI